MNELNALASFVSAVGTGSLTGAARQRRMSQPAVSQQIAGLEGLYDKQLLYRDRNGVRMTEAGEIVFRRASQMLAGHKKLRRELEILSGKISGQLTVTAGLGLSQHVLAEVVMELARQHPDLKVLLRPENTIVDMARENIDLALRFGQLGDSGGFARKIATLEVMYVATPAYLEQVGKPQSPRQLGDLDFIQYRAGGDAFVARFTRGAENIDVPVKTGLTAQLPDLMFSALYSNLGFAQLPVFLVADAIADKRLAPVLENWQSPPTDMFLVTPDRDDLSARAHAFLKVLLQRLNATKGTTLTEAGKKLLNRAI